MKSSLMQFWSKNITVNLFIFLVSLIGLWFIHEWALQGNLNYGFRDGDWWIIYDFRTLGNSPLVHLINTWKAHGVYSYQVYYAGILAHFLDLNFNSLYMASHIFKYLATLSIFPLVYLLSKSKLMAAASTLIYAVSYPSIGALFMFVTGGYYIAIVFMSIFLIMYRLGIVENKPSRWFFYTSILFLITLFLNTERMYPLIPLLVLVEVLLIWKKGWSKDAIVKSVYRLFITFLPLIIFSIVYIIYFIFLKNSMNSTFFVQGFSGIASVRFNNLLHNNWQLLIYPFASFGSLFLYGDFWKIFGVLDLTSTSNFIIYLITKPLLYLLFPTITLISLISKKPLRWVVFILSLLSIFYLIGLWMYRNWLAIDQSIRVHFDPNLTLTPAAFGFYILILSLYIFLTSVKRKETNNLLLVLSVGPLTAFLFIFLTWIYSDVQLLFMGPQRYLTIPAIGSSMFLAGIITLLFSKLKVQAKTRYFAPVILIVLIPVVMMNRQISKAFFDYELYDAGMDGAEQTRMKQEFWSYVPNMSNNERSLFYFDETADKDNGYFDESTIIAGLDDWALFDHGKNVIKTRPGPGILRTNVQCPRISHDSCIELMKSGLTQVNGEEGIWYADPIRYPGKPRFYKVKNLYAFRFINKHLISIRDEVLGELLRK